MRIAIVQLLVMALGVLAAVGAAGKRRGPAEVPPVVLGGVEYRAPHFLPGKPQRGGYLEAWQLQPRTRLWDLQVYATTYHPGLERDVQDVFIVSLRPGAKKDILIVTNEEQQTYEVNVATRTVTRLSAK